MNLETRLETGLETGDLLLFSTNKWYSDVIELGQDCIFSHCGIILKDPTYIDPNLKGLYFLESGSEPFPDAVDHQFHFGVEIVPLENVINEYVVKKEGTIWHRHLICDRNQELEIKIKNIYDTVKNKPYNCDPFDWLEALFGFHLFDCKITSRFWCSALVAYTYVKLNIIQDSIDWTLVTPKEWSSFSDLKFVFLNQTRLEKEIPLI
jgi:hypothetical protein